MIMEPFEVYKYYLALRLHFTTDKYDVIKQQGRVRGSKVAFHKRKDLLSIRRVAETYSDKEVVEFLVSNFISGDRWGGVFDIDAKDRYTQWKKRIESLSYTFQNDLIKIKNACEKQNKLFEDSLISINNQHPLIVKLYLRGDVSIETLVILNKLVEFLPRLDDNLKDDLVWPDLSRTIKKYEPFLNFKKEKYEQLYRRTVGCD